ncbi:hypothetical protein SDC9_128311 [bioreactor metagenome]|uniref:Uncharacterized protein n=1 Tax=bioreactor metagenome TaxID=1076179 RepID=A0A645CWH1_9ZZZZ
MENPGQPRLRAGLDGNACARNGRRCRNAAEERQNHVANALRHELAVAVEPLSGHPSRAGAAKQAFDHAEHGNAERGRKQVEQRLD